VNAAFDKLYEQSLATAPGPARDEIYKKMRDIVVDEAPWIYDTHRVAYRTIHGWTNNFKYNEMVMNFKYVRVDPKKRAELKPKL
jgi:ABC-type transport system substrate-binding protein